MQKIKTVSNIKSFNSDFILLSKNFTKKIGVQWWFLNSSRIDLAPSAKPIEHNFIYSWLNLLKNTANLSYRLVFKIFNIKQNIKIKDNNLFVFEEVKLNLKLKRKEDYYFKNISKLTKIKFINLIISTKFYYDDKNISIFQISNKFDVFSTLIRSLYIYIKFILIKNSVIKKTKNQKFWINYQNKNSFINFYLVNLTYNYFKNFKLKDKLLIYPYEEKPFERALNYKKKYNEIKKIFAYIINPRDKLALYLNSYSSLHIPRSKKYLFPGRLLAKKFIKKGRKNLINFDTSIVGSPKNQNYKISLKKKNTFLILISHRDEFPIIFDWLQDNFKNSNYKFLFRMYPGTDMKNFEINFDKLKNFEISKNKSLVEDCMQSKYAIFSNTSAGIEAVNLGLVSLWVDLYSKDVSPLEKNQKPFFLPSKSKKIFIKNLNKLIKLNTRKYGYIYKLQLRITKNLYSPFDSKQFKILFNTK
jgi:hypothetical protein